MRHLLALTLSLMLVVGGFAASAMTALAYTPDNEELTFLALINDYRGQHGLASLSLNPTLGEAADFHSVDMATTGYFEHTAPNGTTFDQNIRNFGYGGSTMGENIAAGMETASEAMVAWQNSPEHNAGMLNPNFSEIGIGRHHEPNSLYGWYWTTTFGGDGSPRGATEISNNGTGNNGGDGNTNANNGNGNGNTTNDGQVQPADADTVLSEPEVNISEESGNGRTVETQQEVPATTNADGQTVSASDGSGPVNGDGQVTVYDDINTGGVTGDSVNYDQSVTPPTVNDAPADQAAPPPADQAPVEQAPAETAPVEQAPAPQPETTTTTTTYQDTTGTVTDTFTSNIQEGDGSAREMGSNTNSTSTSGTVNTDNTTTMTTDPTVSSGPEAAPVTDEWVDPAATNEEWVEPAPATEEWVDPALAGGAAVDPAQAGMACGNYGTWYDAQTAYENGGGTAADPAFVNSLDPNWDGVACEELMTY